MKKVPEVKSVEELKPLAASIAHNRAVSLLRERFAKKRGEGKTDSLDAQSDEGISQNELTSTDSPLANLEQKELAQRLGKSLTELKPPMGDILSDFFLHGLRYEEIARRRGVASKVLTRAFSFRGLSCAIPFCRGMASFVVLGSVTAKVLRCLGGTRRE